MDSELLKRIVDEYGKSKNLMDLRFVLICVLGFSGFMRISEILALKIRTLFFFVDEGLKIFSETSKSDQLREGHILHISKTDTKCCPTYWLKQYISISKLEKEEESCLICRLAKNKNSSQRHWKIQRLIFDRLGLFQKSPSQPSRRNQICTSFFETRGSFRSC